jgi:hypothetical protein
MLKLPLIGISDYSVLEGGRIGRIRLWNVTVHLSGGLPMGSSKDLDTAKAEFKPQAPDDEPRRGSVLGQRQALASRGHGCKSL